MAGEALRDLDVERFKKLEAVREWLAIAREVGDDRAAPLRDAVSILAGLIEDIVRELASGAPR
jgi:hypothetical protein